MRFKSKLSKKTKVIFLIILTLFFALFCYIYFEYKLSFAVSDIATQTANAKCSAIISKVIYEEIEKSEITYDSLVNFEKDSNKNISALKINSIEINRLKSLLSLKILAQLDKAENSSVKIPIGTILGGEFLFGRGPGIDVKVMPIGTVATEIQNEISSAGINQIRHQIILVVNVQMTVITGIKRLPTNVSTSICIAETVVVGKVPESYTNIDAHTTQNKTGEESIEIDPDTLFNFALN